MEEVKVKVSYLIGILTENRHEHKKAFELAYSGFRNKVIIAMEENLEKAKSGGEVITRIDSNPPIDHTEDYDVALDMLRIHMESEITITQEEYKNLILDKWHWSSSFRSSSSSYASSSSLSS
jgi:hypothetical protein